MRLTVSFRYMLLLILAAFVMFLPRTLYIAGAYSYRIVVLFVFVLFILMFGNSIKIHSFFRNPFLLIYFSVVVVVYIKYNAIISLGGFLLDTVILFFLLTNLLNDKKCLDYFIKIFTTVLILYSFFGVIEFLTGFNIWNVITGVEKISLRFGFYRCIGATSTPINNGHFMILCMPILIDKIINNTNTKERSFFIFAFVMIWLNLICTLSRGPILIGFALNAVWLLKRGVWGYLKKHFKTVIVISVIVVGLAQVPQISSAIQAFTQMFTAMVDENVREEIRHSFGSNVKGIGERVELYDWVWESVQGDVLLGKGPHQAFAYIWYDEYNKAHLKESIENQYLACLFRFGIIGLVTMSCYFLSYLYFIYKKRCERVNTKGKLTSFFLVSTTIIAYLILMFTAAMAEDIKMLYILLAIYFVSEEQKGVEAVCINENKKVLGQI